MTLDEYNQLFGFVKEEIPKIKPEPKKEKEPEFMYETEAESPISFTDRLKLQFGNKEGIKKYLEDQGFDVQFKNNEPFVKQKGQKGSFKPVDEARFGITDIVELLTSAGPNVIGQGIATAAGTTAGGPLGGYVANIGSGLAVEKLKNIIGENLGVYKPSGDFISPEMQTGALIDIVSPGIGKGLKKLGAGFQKQGLESMLRGLGITSLKKSSLKDLGDEGIEKIAKEARKRGLYGKNVASKLTDLMRKTGQEMDALTRNAELTDKEIKQRAYKLLDETMDLPKRSQKAKDIVNELMDSRKQYFSQPSQMLGTAGESTIKGTEARPMMKNIIDFGKKYVEEGEQGAVEKEARSRLQDAMRGLLQEKATDPAAYTEKSKLFRDVLYPLSESLEERWIKDLRKPPFQLNLERISPEQLQDLVEDFGIMDKSTQGVGLSKIGEILSTLGRGGLPASQSQYEPFSGAVIRSLLKEGIR